MSFNPTLADRLEYWNGFYSRQDKTVPQLPSQFSVFSAGEFIGVDAVVEFGCGNGRDSEFFALNGFKVLAFDASSEAIALCRQRTKSPEVQYLLSHAEGSAEHLQDFLKGKHRVAVYARFFLHAIDAEVERSFFDMLENSLPPGSLVFLEYRTKEDESGAKRFGQHYRRYIDHDALIDTLQGAGFSIAYQIQGRGFAKYRDEDALVGRCVAVKG
ncbi:methyltransferase family protein [Pseudomonas sp. SJZ085]|uniref:class I SAM-dependent methyltransferase n=1 Tax=unclassified Pseudomonas TaxID=196821 RepID=UPI00119A1ED9|nr:MULTISPECIES: class I SAM-dependent methyltransferase [unclassified Pseudomonas]TWC21736.1 methyltransferase family protein [Pseudomonas sp. SJZ074]TWC39390.1 methyltransferase family protein [Pseudomonas sp. SJZ085]